MISNISNYTLCSFYRCKFDPVNAGVMEQLECINFMKIKLGS